MNENPDVPTGITSEQAALIIERLNQFLVILERFSDALTNSPSMAAMVCVILFGLGWSSAR